MEGQVIQLEDGSAAYVQHLPMPKAGTLHRPKFNSGYLLFCFIADNFLMLYMPALHLLTNSRHIF